MGERDRPSSPFKSGRKLMKRLSKGPEDVLARAASPTPSSLGFPMAKKMKSSLSLKTTGMSFFSEIYLVLTRETNRP
jgi:hypothetical protein